MENTRFCCNLQIIRFAQASRMEIVRCVTIIIITHLKTPFDVRFDTTNLIF